MDKGDADIIAGIRELRAKAAAQLTGNDYYMIVQQLDSLAASAELSEDSARSVLTLIGARLGGGAPAVSAAGGPEIPEIPDTPAQPDAPSTPDVPVVPDSPAHPGGSPGPEIPSPPSSPAEPPTPPEVSAAPVRAAGSDEPVQIVSPSANSFGMPQATVALRHPELAVPSAPPAAEPETAPEVAPATNLTGGLGSAVMAARTLIEEKLSGNSYYAAATLLGQLQILPPIAGGGEVDRPDNFEGALALLRREAERLTGIAHEEATRVIAALEDVLMRPSIAEKPAEAAAPQPAAPQAVAAEPEPEPRTGFDDLAEAAWQRVRQVSAADPVPASLNGSSHPAYAADSHSADPAPAALAQTATMAQDIGEAFNDGGSESRSSEPCYLNERELAAAQPAASDHQEPAAEGRAEAASETERQAAASAEAEALIASAETGSEAPVAAENANVPTGAYRQGTETESVGLEEAVLLGEAHAAEVEPQIAQPDADAPLIEAIVEAAEPAVEPDQTTLLDDSTVVVATQQTAEPKEPLPEEPSVAAPEPTIAESTEAAPPVAIDLAAVEPDETATLEPVAAQAEGLAVEAEQPVAAPAPVPQESATEPASNVAEAETPPTQTSPAEQAPPAKAAKRGFFGRLFGGSGVENRRSG